MHVRIEISPAPPRFVATRAGQAAERVLAEAGTLLPDLAAALRVGTEPPILEAARHAAETVVRAAGHAGDVRLVLHS